MSFSHRSESFRYLEKEAKNHPTLYYGRDRTLEGVVFVMQLWLVVFDNTARHFK